MLAGRMFYFHSMIQEQSLWTERYLSLQKFLFRYTTIIYSKHHGLGESSIAALFYPSWDNTHGYSDEDALAVLSLVMKDHVNGFYEIDIGKAFNSYLDDYMKPALKAEFVSSGIDIDKYFNQPFGDGLQCANRKQFEEIDETLLDRDTKAYLSKLLTHVSAYKDGVSKRKWSASSAFMLEKQTRYKGFHAYLFEKFKFSSDQKGKYRLSPNWTLSDLTNYLKELSETTDLELISESNVLGTFNLYSDPKFNRTQTKFSDFESDKNQHFVKIPLREGLVKKKVDK